MAKKKPKNLLSLANKPTTANDVLGGVDVTLPENAKDWEKFCEALTDQRWRLDNLYHIKDKSGKKILFKMNDGQRELYERRWLKNIILKARQRGYTTFICILALDFCLFHPNFTAGINAHNLEDAQSFFKDKVRFAYDNLPEWVKKFTVADTSSAKELSFSNGSRIRVGTSLRSGTYQLVHISEFGKICAKYYEKAREIVTGTLNAVGKDQMIFIESTAEGKGGFFYDMTQTSQSHMRKKMKLSKLDYKFFFSPWWQDPEYRLHPEGIPIAQKYRNYFITLKNKYGIETDESQQAWYVKKAAEQKDDMKREYPSHPDEAFELIVKGAFYGEQIKLCEEQKRVCRIKPDPNLPIFTAWDLGGAGGGDYTAIWFFQVVGKEIRFIDYWEGHSYSMVQIIQQVIKKKHDEEGYRYGQHFAPHDIDVTDYSAFHPETYEPMTRKQIAAMHGVEFTKVPRMGLSDGIESVRNSFYMFWFDEENTEFGRNALREYQHAFDERNGVFRPEPLKNWACHGADGIRYATQAYSLFISPPAMNDGGSIEEHEARQRASGI